MSRRPARTGLRCALSLLVALAGSAAHAQVRIVTGPTPILRGNARAAGDITVVNEHLAFAIAVESAMPYGVPRGGIVDVAPVVDGRIGEDRVVFADFIPNDWTAWPNTWQRVQVLHQDAREVRIRSERDWGQVRISTEYVLAQGADAVQITTSMTNEGGQTLTGLQSGLTLWPSAGYFFEVPGVAPVQKGAADHALADRVTAYDAGWSITLHAPYMDHIDSSGRDMLLLHTLRPKETRRFEARLQVGTRGDLAPVMAAEIERKGLPWGTVSGEVRTRDGRPVAIPVVVVEHGEIPLGWIVGAGGRFEAKLPVGQYRLYATAADHAQGRTRELAVTAGSRTRLDFDDLLRPGRLELSVGKAGGAQPLDARVSIQSGQKNVVQYLGRQVFFTGLDARGQLRTAMAPGDYELRVSAGGGFLRDAREIHVRVTPGRTTIARATLEGGFDPRARGWFAADLHHHADQAEAVTPAPWLARSQLAAGLDLLFVGDHDSTVNHAPLAAIAARRGVPFIPSVELSPSWGHFNAWPLRAGEPLGIDTSTAEVGAVFAEARRLGATILQVNHPFITYGYLTSVAAGTVPGRFDAGFDLLEINASESGDDLIAAQLQRYWSAGHRIYFTAGTDTHDVWRDESGRVRLFAQVEGPLSAQGYARAVKDGHAYVSYGPLLYPSIVFGDTLRLNPGTQRTWDIGLQSVAGLATARLLGESGVLEERRFDAHPRSGHAEFTLQAGGSRWYAIIVEDAAGHRAWSDPLWIDTLAP